MAIRGTTASLSRTGVAVAALAVAVATVIGVGLMVSSFRDQRRRLAASRRSSRTSTSSVDEAWCRGAGGVGHLAARLRELARR
jgi:putative ABC transport system permease protein